MDDLWTIQEEATMCQPVSKKKRSAKQKQFCPHCGKSSHTTTRSKKCDHHGNKEAPTLHRKSDGLLLSTLPPASDAGERTETDSITPGEEAKEMNEMDGFPLQDEDDSISSQQENERAPPHKDAPSEDAPSDDETAASGDDETVDHYSVYLGFREEGMDIDSDTDSLGSYECVESFNFDYIGAVMLAMPHRTLARRPCSRQ